MTQIILTSGTSWTVPTDWNNAANTIECIGGGAGGGNGTTVGGPGGSYAKISNLTLTPGNAVAYQIGAGGAAANTAVSNPGGDTWFDSTATVQAKGVGSASANVGSVTYAGGGASRAGGGAAGKNGAGGSGTTTTGGTGDAGSGGAGGGVNTNGSAGTEWGSAGSGGGGGTGTSTSGAGGAYGGGGAAGSGIIGASGAHGVIVINYTPAAGGSETFTLDSTLQASALSGTMTDGHALALNETLAPSTLSAELARVDTLAVGATLATSTLYSDMQSAGAPPMPSFQATTTSSSVEIYNRALARVGIDQFLGDPNETSKAGSLYRMWYDACRQTCLRDFPWNFATTIVPLALLANVTIPGWTYAYAYPVDCLQARQVCDANGARTTLNNWLGWGGDAFPFSEFFQGGYPNIGVPKVPFKVLSSVDSTGAPQRVLVTDMPDAYLLYTLNVTDTGQFDAGFTDAFEWLIASEIAAPFLGAPAGQQVAQACGKYYMNAVLSARAQNLNESTPDTRPDSPAIAARA